MLTSDRITIANTDEICYIHAADAGAVSCSIKVSPDQDLNGKASPCPAGKNKLPFPYKDSTKTLQSLTFRAGTDGRINISGSFSTGTLVFYLGDSATNRFVLPAGTYTLSTGVSAGRVRLDLYKVGTSGIFKSTGSNGKVTFTTDDSATYYCQLTLTTTGSYSYTIYPQLEAGGDRTDFEAYSGNICQIGGKSSVKIETYKGENLLPPFGDQWVTGSTSSYYGTKTSDTATAFPFGYSTTGSSAYTDVPVYVFHCAPSTGYRITPPKHLKVIVSEYASLSDIGNSANAIAKWSSSSTDFDETITKRTSSTTNYLVIGFTRYNGDSIVYVTKNTEFSMVLADPIDVSFSTTVYSGELTVNADGTGTLKSTHKMISFNGTTSGRKVTTKGTSAGNYNLYQLTVNDGYAFGETDEWVTPEELAAAGYISNYAGLDGQSEHVYIGAYINSSSQLVPSIFTDEGITNVTPCNNWLKALDSAGTPFQLLYPLAEPITYTLTPGQVALFQGDNYIKTSAGIVTSLNFQPSSAAVWDAIRTGDPTHAQMIFSDQGVTLNDEDIAMDEGITVNDVLNADTDLTFGRAVCKQITARIILTEKTRYMKWTDPFELRFGVDICGTTCWTTIGYFSGERPKNLTGVDSVEFTAYDAMKKFDADAEDFLTSATSATIEDLYEDLCTYVGVPFESAPDDQSGVWETAYDASAMFGGDYNTTCQQVLAWIAEAAGYYARINSAGNCELIWYASEAEDVTVGMEDQFETDYSDLYSGITWDEFDEYTWDQADEHTWDDICGDFREKYKIGSVLIRKGSTSIQYPSWMPNSYVIDGNPFAIAVIDLAQYHYMRLVGLWSSMPLTVTCIGNWMIEAGDTINVQLPEQTVPMRIYVRTLRWNGAVEDTYETTGQVERTGRK